MRIPTLDLRKGAVTAIKAAMTTNGYTATCVIEPDHGQTLPYVLIADATATERSNKTHDGTNATALFVAWADTVDAAEALANIVLGALHSRTTPITVDSTTKLITYHLESTGPMIRDDLPGNDAYGVPVRMRYRTHE